MFEDTMKSYKLTFECVPEACWRDSLAQRLPRELWDKIRKDAYARAGHRCSICGAKGRLEAHEKWSYDEKKGIQKLEDIIAVCKDCHSAIHIGYTSIKGNLEKAENHYMKVNGVSYAIMKNDLSIANQKHKKLNEVSEWKLDLSFLKRYIKD